MKTQKIANGTEVSYLNFSTGKTITETGIIEHYAKDHKKYTVRKSDNSIAWVPECQITKVSDGTTNLINLETLINDKTYQVIDQASNRFNFCDLVDIDEQLIEDAEYGDQYQLTDQLPEDVKRAVDTMIENDVKLEDYTGIIVFEDEDTTYYILTW